MTIGRVTTRSRHPVQAQRPHYPGWFAVILAACLVCFPVQAAAQADASGRVNSLAKQPDKTNAIGALLEQGADPNWQGFMLRTALHEAAIACQPHNLELLLRYEADPGRQDLDGNTPLHFATGGVFPAMGDINNCRIDSVRALLEGGADPNQVNAKGNAPLHAVVSDGPIGSDVEAANINALLDAGADPNLANVEGNGPLHFAFIHTRASLNVAGALLDGGAQPDTANARGMTPLMLAARHGGSAGSYGDETVALLLDVGADPNRTNPDGDAPLHILVKKEPDGDSLPAAAIAEALLAGGADPCMRDADGSVPYEYVGSDSPVANALTNVGGSLSPVVQVDAEGNTFQACRADEERMAEEDAGSSGRGTERTEAEQTRAGSDAKAQGTGSPAGILYDDEHGIKVEYQITDTGQYTYCDDSNDAAWTDEKIKVWKATVTLTNDSGQRIKPLGEGAATISVAEQGDATSDYCFYSAVPNFISVGYPEQGGPAFGITVGKVYSVKPGRSLSGSKYLYLYESRKPVLTDWFFAGYEFLPDKNNGSVGVTQVGGQTDEHTGATGQSAGAETDGASPATGPSGSLVLLMDVSGSMEGVKLESAKQAAVSAIRKAIKNNTELAILTFEGDCGDPINASIGFTQDEDSLITFVEGLTALGGTPLATSLEVTNRFMAQHKSPGSQVQMILLLADGDDDCGGLNTVLQVLKQDNLLYRHETVGLEVSDAARRQLQTIAAQSGGNYHHATSDNLSKVFADAVELMRMLDMLGNFN